VFNRSAGVPAAVAGASRPRVRGQDGLATAGKMPAPQTQLLFKLQLPKVPSTEKPIEARRFLVRGRVQGVGFRWFVEREAHMLGIAGWVRNNHDGSVEVLAQGTRDQLSGLHSRLREGPRAARVDAVEVSEASPIARLTAFRIEGAW
jgi:acylphosphatase